MKMLRRGLLLGGLFCASAACASAPHAVPATVAAPPSVASAPPAPPVAAPAPRQLTADAWAALRTSGAVVELERVGEPREQYNAQPSEVATPPGTLRLVRCAPGGGDEFVARERESGALWRVVAVGGIHAPPGVQISATRCFEADYRLPEGATIAGRMTVSYR